MKKTGKGQKIETNLLNSIIGFHIQEITAYLYQGKNPERSESGIPNPWLGAPYGLYNTKNGYIAIGMGSVRKIANIIGLNKYDTESFDSNNIIEGRDAIREDFDQVFRTKKTEEWLSVLLENDIWCSQVNTFDEMVDDPQVAHNQMIINYEHPAIGEVQTTGFSSYFSETPQQIYRPAPLLNQHANEILSEFCGYNEEEISQYINKI